MLRTLSACLLFAICTLLAACAQSRKPIVLLESATLAEETQDSASRTVLVTLLANNPGDQPIPLREVRYELRAGNYTSGELSRDAQRTIPRFGALALTLPVPVPSDVAQQIASGGPWTVQGDVGYVPFAAYRRTLYESRIAVPRVAIEERR